MLEELQWVDSGRREGERGWKSERIGRRREGCCCRMPRECCAGLIEIQGWQGTRVHESLGLVSQ